MLLRSSSTPFLQYSFLSSSSPSSPSSLRLRRAVSESHLHSLHPSSDDDNHTPPKKNTTLHTELSFSIYNKFQKPCHQEQHQEQEHNNQQQQEQPDLPLFLARGLGIDRIASGLFTVGCNSTKAGVFKGSVAGGDHKKGGVEEMASEQDQKVLELDVQYKKMVGEEPSNALFLRNYAQFLHQVGEVEAPQMGCLW